VSWADARGPQCVVQLLLPPNSPTCVAWNNSWDPGLNSATSNHTGGVNGARVDGSVSFVSDTVNSISSWAGNALTEVTRWYHRPTDEDWPGGQSGQSNYGTWGAMATIDGGESVSL